MRFVHIFLWVACFISPCIHVPVGMSGVILPWSGGTSIDCYSFIGLFIFEIPSLLQQIQNVFQAFSIGKFGSKPVVAQLLIFYLYFYSEWVAQLPYDFLQREMIENEYTVLPCDFFRNILLCFTGQTFFLLIIYALSLGRSTSLPDDWRCLRQSDPSKRVVFTSGSPG